MGDAIPQHVKDLSGIRSCEREAGLAEDAGAGRQSGSVASRRSRSPLRSQLGFDHYCAHCETPEDAETACSQWRDRPLYHIADAWPEQTVQWLRRLGGKPPVPSDRDGTYVLLPGIRAVFVSIATLALASEQAFPR